MKEISVKKACLHNLKNIDVKIPKDKFVVVTGVSGSGKSSLIFDTIYEAGRKGYLQAIGMLPAIDENEYYESIDGIGPTIAVKQKIIRESNPRSIVGTRTEIFDYLRALYSLEGKMTCSVCGNLMEKSSAGNSLVCAECGNEEDRLIAGYFSFNSPYGMCYRCKGRGQIIEVNLNKVIQDENLNLMQICSSIGFPLSRAKKHIPAMMKRFNVDLKTPFKELSEEIKELFLNGGSYSEYEEFWGISKFLRYMAFKNKALEGKAIEGVLERKICPECNGYKVCTEGLSVTLSGMNIGEVGSLTILELKSFLEEYKQKPEDLNETVKKLIDIIISKVNSLIEVGLSYLTLYREMPTLSGGEVQRLFLMSHLESEIESIIYIFDEPTCGLHEVEKKSLISKIKRLQENNNTVIVVEHDKNSMDFAEHIIDFGPYAGELGGEVVYSGDVKGILDCENSITGKYLSGKMKMPCKTENDYKVIDESTKWIKIKGAEINNLKNIDVSIPLGCIVGIAGVSGSGKSSLTADTIVPLLKEHFHKADAEDDLVENNSSGLGESSGDNLESSSHILEDDSYESTDSSSYQSRKLCESIEGFENISDFSEVSQAQIGRNKRSIPLTYLGIWDNIRQLFADTSEAKSMKLAQGHFSFNSKGSCPDCKGIGHIEKLLGELGSVTSLCSECEGKRYKSNVLKVKYKGKSIADVLEMSIEEGAELFKDDEHISYMLKTMIKAGMGYIKMGQPTPTISGGEAQRIKLARELGSLKNNKENNRLFILDEPTTGLSFFDTANLLLLLKELADEGNSILVVEHDPHVLSYCDWILELGPNGGKDGGQIIAEGSPLQLKQNSNSIIGKFLGDI